MIGQFGQRLGGSDTNAAGNADPLQNSGPYLEAALDKVAANASQVNEGFVDGVNLLLRPQARCQAHHPVAQVTVERKVCRQRYQL